MIGVMLALLILPLAAGIVSFWVPARAAAGITVASGIACFGLVLTLIPHLAHGTVSYLSYLRADAVSGVFLLATGFLYAAVAVYASGYLKGRSERYTRRFYLGFNLFAWAMLAATIEVASGAAMVAGFRTREFALLLVIFNLCAAAIGHPYWSITGDATARWAQLIHFWKDIGLAGGALFVLARGAGPLSIDRA